MSEVSRLSQQYRDLLVSMHEGQSWGTTGHRYIHEFLPFCRELKCKDILDYGSGRGTIKRLFDRSDSALSAALEAKALGQYSDLPTDFVISEYDPGTPDPALWEEPKPAPFVVCTDVMEHVEPEYVDKVLDHICQLTLVGAYFSIGLVKAKRCLPNGSNAHITIQPADWWLDRLRQRPWTLVRIYEGSKKPACVD